MWDTGRIRISFLVHVVKTAYEKASFLFTPSHVYCHSYCKGTLDEEFCSFRQREYMNLSFLLSLMYKMKIIRLGSKNIMEYSRNRLNRASASMWWWKWPSCSEMVKEPWITLYTERVCVISKMVKIGFIDLYLYHTAVSHFNQHELL